jgi:hypothetical protein
MKSSINQMKTVKSTTHRLDRAEERISGTEDKVEEVLQSDNKEEKNNNPA